MSLTKVRYVDLESSLQDLLDAFSTHRHDGVEDVTGNPDIPGGARISFTDLKNIPQELIDNPSTLIVGEIPTPAANNSQFVFTLSSAILDDNKEAVYLHGRRMSPIDDYTASGTQITFLVAPPSGSKIVVDYQPVI